MSSPEKGHLGPQKARGDKLSHLPGLSQLVAASSVGDLPSDDCPVDIQTLSNRVDALFKAKPHLPGVLVIEDGKLRGIISRSRFLEHLTRPFGPEIYLNRPVSLMMSTINLVPTAVPMEYSIDEAARIALSRPGDQIYEPIALIRPQGGFRLLDIQVLLQALSQVLTLHNRENDRLLSEIRDYAGRLEETLAELRDTQANLVQAEKMASLGSLVAGVAHEINTPIGITVGASSHLFEATGHLRGIVENGKVRKSDFNQYLETATEATRLIQVNCNRAAELIQSFKQVAVDQTSAERRVFRVKHYLEEILMSVKPKLRSSGAQVVVDCPDMVEMDSFPGAFSQVLTNLILNAILHAYDEGKAGTLSIAVKEIKGSRIELRFSDDGKGIPPDNISKIFDPFFTTKRGQGGSGLGLNIVFNLVSNTLKGDIAVASDLGKGTTFTLRLPQKRPKDKDQA